MQKTGNEKDGFDNHSITGIENAPSSEPSLILNVALVSELMEIMSVVKGELFGAIVNQVLVYSNTY